MRNWSELLKRAEEHSRYTTTEGRMMVIRPEILLELIEDAQKGESKPKSVAEDIFGWMREPTINCIEEDYPKVCMALAEAVKWIDSQSHDFPKLRARIMGSILAILRGEKTREIPKPKEGSDG